MTRSLLREFARTGWHLDGMTWEAYLRLTFAERWFLHAEIDDMIRRTDPEEGGVGANLSRPKSWRK